MLYKLLKPFYPVLYKVVKWYHRKPRMMKKRGILLRLLPSVFHPSYYLSTDIFLDYLLTLEIEGKRVLELGCGSGFLSLYLAKHKNIESYASDINKVAVEGLRANAALNDLDIKVYHSDLFDDIPSITYDYVIINPPYFKKDPASTDEFAFYAGADLQYFRNLFSQLSAMSTSVKEVLMILSENVDMKAIEVVGNNYNHKLSLVKETVKNAEVFLVFKVN